MQEAAHIDRVSDHRVTDNSARKRFELELEEGGTAYVDYSRSPGVVKLLYAKVPRGLEGRGHGSQVVRGALELVRAEGARVIPRCAFVAAYIRRHPEYQDLLAER
jgi:predicted GNAT family acetyltransferase